MTTASGPSEATHPRSGAYPDQPRVAVGAVVFRDDAVLLVKRGKPPGEGHWAIPGGSVRLGESLKAAVERELLEETGVRVQAGQPVLTFETIHKDADGRVVYHYIIIDLEAVYVAGEPVAADDAADARWVTQEELERLEVVPATRRFLRQHYGFGCTP
jgi:8-oxo-dGTP diphosphatase